MTQAGNQSPRRRELPHGFEENGSPPEIDGFSLPERPSLQPRSSLNEPLVSGSADQAQANVVAGQIQPGVNALADQIRSAEPVEAVADGRGGRAKRKSRGNLGWELLQTVALALLVFLLVRAVAQNFRVEGPSMEPGLHNGQHLLVNKAVYFKLDLDTLDKFLPFIDSGDGEERFLFHPPHRGEVIVFRFPEDPRRDFIKRVIGVPGDVVSIHEGTVFVNGVALQEPYANGESRSNLSERTVPPDAYFVLGDNRANSSDSRTWGYVPEQNIIGKAMLSYWPLSELGGVGNTSLDLGFIRVPFF